RRGRVCSRSYMNDPPAIPACTAPSVPSTRSVRAAVTTCRVVAERITKSSVHVLCRHTLSAMRKLIFTLVLAGCGSSSAPEAERPVEFGGDRPVALKVPAGFAEGKTYPLVLVLHGFGATGFVQAAYFGASALPGQDRAFVLAPDGTANSEGRQF